jgi:SAM-dependent methyltransferase
VLDRFFAQFSGPRGPLGHLAGWLMARKNLALNGWIAELADVGPGDRALEVGFGPGLLVARLSERAAFVAGVDRSEVMLQQALRRNARVAREGRVELRLGRADELPFDDACFTHACSVNSLQFWPSVEDGLGEIRRVLAGRGRLVLAQRMHREGVGRFDRSRFGMSEARVGEIASTLERAGFERVALRWRDFGSETIAALMAHRAIERRAACGVMG